MVFGEKVRLATRECFFDCTRAMFLTAMCFAGNTFYTVYEKRDWGDKFSTSQVTVANHDMFCPGTAVLHDGRVLITGGSSSNKTTIFTPTSSIHKSNSWESAAEMHIGRGYHAMTMLTDGSVLALGGSWGPTTLGGKVGEIWDPNTEKWTLMSGIESAPLVTDDNQGIYRSGKYPTVPVFLFSPLLV